MTPLLAAPILLSLTLATSGIAKLGDRRATEDAMRSLRLPARALHPAIAAALPWVELALAVLTWVPVRGVQVAVAAAALLLTVAYLAIIARALRFPEPVTCSCFGTLGSPTVSRTTAVRNAVLVLLAVAALVAAALGTTADAERGAPGHLLGWAAAIVVAVLLAGLTLGTARGTAPAWPATPAAPAAAAPSGGFGTEGSADDASDETDLDYERRPVPHLVVRARGGELMPLTMLAAQRAVLLLWMNPGCGPCERVFDELPRWREDLAGRVDVRVVLGRDVTAVDDALLARTGDDVIEDLHGTLAAALDAWGTPSAVLLGADGLLAGGPVSGGGDVIEFVGEIIDQLREAEDAGLLPPSGDEPEPVPAP